MLRKCEMSACADVGKFHFTSSKARYFTMCGSTLFHVLRKQNISLYAFVSSNAVLVKKKGRGIFAILRPFPVGRYFDFVDMPSLRSALYICLAANSICFRYAQTRYDINPRSRSEHIECLHSKHHIERVSVYRKSVSANLYRRVVSLRALR